MEWVEKLYTPYIRRTFKWEKRAEVPPEVFRQRFEQIFSESLITILVQEPWYGTVRFKGLARHFTDECGELIANPEAYLVAHYGGGKFKLNFHHGWNFVATINFKPPGAPAWQDLPAIDY